RDTARWSAMSAARGSGGAWRGAAAGAARSALRSGSGSSTRGGGASLAAVAAERRISGQPVALAAFFTWLNPGEIQVDLGLAVVDAPLGLAVVLALAAGWLLGIISALMWVARISVDRRRL